MRATMIERTPKDLTITPRDRRFRRNQAQGRWWLAGDPIATPFYNGLSITFPEGLVDSDYVAPRLPEAMAA